MSDDIDEVMGRLIHGVHYDAEEARDHPELFRARMDGVRIANRRWNLWLQSQGYTRAQATAIILDDNKRLGK